MNDGEEQARKAEPKVDTKADPGEVGERLEKDIDQIRDNLGDLVGELDHRRHELFDWRLQLRRHALSFAIGTAVVAGLIVGGVAIHRARQPRHPRLTGRWKDIREGLALAAGQRRPEPKVKPAFVKQIAGAAAAAVVSVLARRLAERFVKRRAQPAR